MPRHEGKEMTNVQVSLNTEQVFTVSRMKPTNLTDDELVVNDFLRDLLPR